MEPTSLPSYIAGVRVEPDPRSPTLTSFDGRTTLPVSETTAVQLRRALRHADDCQEQLDQTSLEERIAVARLIIREYAKRADDACFALARFRGITAKDTRWMCDVNLRWAEDLDRLVDVMWSGVERGLPMDASGPPKMFFQSKGKAALFSSSTMDGPPAVVAICHAVLAGTHLIFKPSFRDAATHFALDTLYAHGQAHYAQLVRFRSDSSDAPQLNRQLVNQVSQAVIFSSNQSYRDVIDSAARPGTDDWDALRSRVKRYGTGLPVAIVTKDADLDEAARDLVEGARLGGGRFCLSACPVLVDRRVHDALASRIVENARALRRGDPLDPRTELSAHDPADALAISGVLQSFGGEHAFGDVREGDMDVHVRVQVPVGTPALFREIPGTALALIPVDDLAQAVAVAADALRKNARDSWTAVVFFGARDDFRVLPQRLAAFRYLHGGVVARVKLLLPHQGAYFALDLMRRVTVE